MLWLISLLISLAHADVPYDSLETIRQQTIVTRVVVDHPGQEMLKGCPSTQYLSALGQKLALAYDNEDIVWSNAVITSHDLSLLSKRVLSCRRRASCGVYSRFLEKAVKDQASASTVSKLQSTINPWLQEITSKEFLAALPSVPEPCRVLKSLL